MPETTNHRRFSPVWAFIALLLFAAGSWFAWRWRIELLPLAPAAPPALEMEANGKFRLRFPGFVFVTKIASFRDELFAYLMFQHYRSTGPLAQEDLVLRYHKDGEEARYEVLLVLSDDMIPSIDRVAQLAAASSRDRFEGIEWNLIPVSQLEIDRKQTHLFESAYNLPVRKKMEDLSTTELRSLAQRFIRFKSTTDPRIRKGLEPVPQVLSPSDAHRIAEDIILVADFYHLPLEFFLGIGAIENNYMNVRGDLQHSIWKRQAAEDDIVLERRNGRVRVLNDSAGVWQITRQTLRQVHKHYLADKRDYTKLPARLRPPRQLKMKNLDPEILTTYAGLLFRTLLDHFKGNVTLAVGAYNGGPGKPNMRYEEGVRSAALHARDIIEKAAVLNGLSVMNTPWITSR
ncbi:transglycosylase SLT domain-containing protein [Bryobacter aggregatus]|uniref:transglycosylase SLT domain-containing protein n=1 Tax=Bryobacter aggregatus TaxID=360054 RepID=UPI0004E0D950|nr:transglycosylase SLT domain-containing protein [Bryobacter aggregatus]